MRTIATATVVASLLTFVERSAGAPCAFYNPANGNIRMINDTGAPLAAFYLLSQSGDKFPGQNAATYPQIPGATLDLGDLPLGFTYLNFPNGSYNIGNVAMTNTPLSDFVLGYYFSLSQPGFTTSLFAWTPEPGTGVLATLGVVALAGTRRKTD